MATKFPITQKEFKAFLASRKTLKFWGNSHCPIAAAINHKINRGKKKDKQELINVGSENTYIGHGAGDSPIVNPKWVQRFIERFDNMVDNTKEFRRILGRISDKDQLTLAKRVANV